MFKNFYPKTQKLYFNNFLLESSETVQGGKDLVLHVSF